MALYKTISLSSTYLPLPSWRLCSHDGGRGPKEKEDRYADDTTLMAESKEELDSLLMKVKKNEKADLKLNIQKTKIMASCPITSWQIDGKQWK